MIAVPTLRRSRLLTALLVPLLAVTAACGHDGPDGSTADRSVARTSATEGGSTAAAPPGAASGAALGARVVVRGVDLTGIGYDLGSPEAPIQVVEFSDFGCPYCASFALETEPELMREFVASGQVYWKYVPFVIGMFPNGDAAARAAECAAEEGRFWPARDSIYARQPEWKRASDPLPALQRILRSAGVADERFAGCWDADPGRARTSRANAAATRLGVRATPTFFINERMVEGALPTSVFRGGLRQLVRELEGGG